MAKMTEVAFLVLVIVAISNGAKIGANCGDHGDCSKDVANSFCFKLSDCGTGVCTCVHDYYLKDGTTCVKATTLIAKGKTCNPKKVGELCSGMPYVGCTMCGGGGSKEYKCRSTGSGIHVATSLVFVIPMVYNLIF